MFLDALFTVIIRHQARDLGHPALGIHGDGGVSALYPEIDPFVICRAVAAVHENNARHLIFRARPLWNTDKGKYFGILARCLKNRRGYSVLRNPVPHIVRTRASATGVGKFDLAPAI